MSFITAKHFNIRKSATMCVSDFVTQHRLIVAASRVPSNCDWSKFWFVTRIQRSGLDPGTKGSNVRNVLSTAWPSFSLLFSLFPRQIPHMYHLGSLGRPVLVNVIVLRVYLCSSFYIYTKCFEAFQPHQCIRHRNERFYSASSIYPSNLGWQTIYPRDSTEE